MKYKPYMELEDQSSSQMKAQNLNPERCSNFETKKILVPELRSRAHKIALLENLLNSNGSY